MARSGTELEVSEDSDTINTAFMERLNLTLRQSSAYLRRKTSAHPHSMRRLAGSLELLRAWYTFSRPHRGLKFGRECRTPAQLAGLASLPSSEIGEPRTPPAPPRGPKLPGRAGLEFARLSFRTLRGGLRAAVMLDLGRNSMSRAASIGAQATDWSANPLGRDSVSFGIRS